MKRSPSALTRRNGCEEGLNWPVCGNFQPPVSSSRTKPQGVPGSVRPRSQIMPVGSTSRWAPAHMAALMPMPVLRVQPSVEVVLRTSSGFSASSIS